MKTENATSAITFQKTKKEPGVMPDSLREYVGCWLKYRSLHALRLVFSQPAFLD